MFLKQDYQLMVDNTEKMAREALATAMRFRRLADTAPTSHDRLAWQEHVERRMADVRELTAYHDHWKGFIHDGSV